jgi:hypothetical protein
MKESALKYTIMMGAGDEWAVAPFDRPEPRGYVEPSPRMFGAMADTLGRLGGFVKEVLNVSLSDAEPKSMAGGILALPAGFSVLIPLLLRASQLSLPIDRCR